MPLSAGDRYAGHFDVAAPLGAGGMGEASSPRSSSPSPPGHRCRTTCRGRCPACCAAVWRRTPGTACRTSPTSGSACSARSRIRPGSSRPGFNFWASFSVSRTGTVAWREADTAGSVRWIEPTGDEWTPGAIGDLDAPRNPRLSPDGRRLALVVDGDLWVWR